MNIDNMWKRREQIFTPQGSASDRAPWIYFCAVRWKLLSGKIVPIQYLWWFCWFRLISRLNVYISSWWIKNEPSSCVEAQNLFWKKIVFLQEVSGNWIRNYDDCEFSLTKQFEAIFFFAQRTKNHFTNTRPWNYFQQLSSFSAQFFSQVLTFFNKVLFHKW